MYSSGEQEQNTSYLQPCAAGRSLQQLSAEAHHQRGQADPAGGVQVQQQPRRAAGKKKPGARPPSRRSSTTVVATDVANFRAMVQELTGFPPAAIFRPLPRRVHAAVSNNPAFALAASGLGHQFQGDGGGQGLETTMNTTVSSLGRDAPAVQPLSAPPPPGVFDGLSDIRSPVFDSWADLSIIE
ncbi:hypothetical protein PR202_gb09870 [Eleusine coracana subsp. coracana]|uniref:VQ domain-containing protein n=1 Tax=Eleusine coracana subsp. coracana TaxID=191504 RepID=A0AAV5EJ65_ELECO|nr:hypothetical protein QOZ80_2BG0201660 [Eleusine coracana subsp. coracana]GJN22315.1 hypothetical protein PR202_gb09870 [Eleusine coracana subsp. coracana]